MIAASVRIGGAGSAWRRRVSAVAAGMLWLAAAGAGTVAAFHHWAAGLPPIDLAAPRERSTAVLDRNGVLLRAYTTPSGRWRLPATVHDVDPRYLDMLVAFEDKRFFTHRGVDALALLRAAMQMAIRGRVVSGGSTLTMQVARLLEPREDRTIAAKLRQGARAYELERRLSKAEILNLYLSLAPFGGNIEGVRAATFAYFAKEPTRLSPAEAALLVALPQSPELRRPDRHAARARQARDRVLSRLAAAGKLGAADAELARQTASPDRRAVFPMLAAHAADRVLKARPAQAVIRTTIDARLQANLEALVRERVARFGDRVSAAVIVVDNATGDILAHISGAEFLEKDRAGGVDLTMAVRSPGSALKPFIYALAFESGLAHPETILTDRPNRWASYAPENFDQTFQGNISARRALQHSLNLPAVDLLSEIGPHRFISRLRAAGADIVLPKDTAVGLAVGLGGIGIRLTDLALLFHGLARGGRPEALRLDAEARPAGELRAIAEPVAAWYIYDILRDAPPPDNAPRARFAFKTGTSYGYRDAWAAGFDRRYTVAVWVGRPDGAPVAGLIGRQVAAPVLFDVYARLGGEAQPPVRPKGVIEAANAQLPPPLRYLRRDLARNPAEAPNAPLKIAYPPAGARVDLGLTGPPANANPLAIKILGGMPPFVWMVNGAPIDGPPQRRTAFWHAEGAGFARLTVIDATGATDTVQIRLE